jgi:hypothetical protein
MSADDYLENLQETLDILDDALHWLERSYTKCQTIGMKATYTEDEFDIFETLTSRFARVADILIHKVFRSLDAVELETGGTMLDVVHRAEKRGFFESVDDARLIKDLRNQIVHEYVTESIVEMFTEVLRYTAILLQVIQKTKTYCRQYQLHTSAQQGEPAENNVAVHPDLSNHA